MVSVKAEITKESLAKTIAPVAKIQESDIAVVFDPNTAVTARPKYRDFIDSLTFDYDLRLQLIGYGIDDQPSPRLHPLFDSEGSQKFRFGGRAYSRDKKYTAGAGTPDPGTVDFKPAAGSPMEIESLILLIGGTKATAAIAYIGKENSANKDLGMYSRDGAIAINEILAIPALGRRQNGVAATTETVDSSIRTVIHNPDLLRVSVKTMANAEIFTVRARMLIHGPTDPTVAVQADLTEANE